MAVPGEGAEDEVRDIDGRRWGWSALWCGVGRSGKWRAEMGDNAIPQVMCACGETRFQIGYGSYECIAHCNCGRSFLIYDG